MEGEQKVDLPLNGELDIKSSDMLVPVTQAKFAHNRQRWQGHVLPSSLRYEHDGWAAGWNVYNLDFTDKVFNVAGYKIRRTDYNDNCFKFSIYTGNSDAFIGSFVYDTVTKLINTSLSDAVTIESKDYDSRELYTISFNVPYLGNKSFVYDPLSKTVSPSDNDIAVTATLAENCNLTFSIDDLANKVDVNIDRLTLASTVHGSIDTADVSIDLDDFMLNATPTLYTLMWHNNKYELHGSIDKSNLNVIHLSLIYKSENSDDTILYEADKTISYDHVGDITLDEAFSFNINATGTSSLSAAISNTAITGCNIVSGGSSRIRPYNVNKGITYLYDGYSTLDEDNTPNYEYRNDCNRVYYKIENNVVTATLPVYISGIVTFTKVNGSSNTFVKVYEGNVEKEYSCTVREEPDPYSESTMIYYLMLHPTDYSNSYLRSGEYFTVRVIMVTSQTTTSEGDSTTYKVYPNVPIFPTESSLSHNALGSAVRGKVDKVATPNANGFVMTTIFSSYLNLGVVCQKLTTDDNGSLKFVVSEDYTASELISTNLYTPDEAHVVYLDRGNNNLYSVAIDDVSEYSGEFSNLLTTVSLNNIDINIVPNYSNFALEVVRTHEYGDDQGYGGYPAAIYSMYSGNNSAYCIDTIYISPETRGKDNYIISADDTQTYIDPATYSNDDSNDNIFYSMYLRLTIDVSYMRYANAFNVEYAECGNDSNYIIDDVLPTLLKSVQVYSADLPHDTGNDIVQNYTVNLLNESKVAMRLTYNKSSKTVSVIQTELFTVNSAGISFAVDIIDVDTYLDSMTYGLTVIITTVESIPVVFNTFAVPGITDASGDIELIAYTKQHNANVNKLYLQSNSATSGMDIYVYNLFNNTVSFMNDSDTDKVTYTPFNEYSAHLSFNLTPRYIITAELNSVVFYNNITYAAKMHDADVIRLKLSNTVTNYITFDLQSTGALDKVEHGSLTVNSVNITDETCTVKDIININRDEEFQIIKQFWNTTTEIEKYWWLDATRVLVLDKYNFTCYTKEAAVTAWDGNKWRKTYTVSRASIITSDVMQYLVPNKYGNSPQGYFITYKVENNNTITYSIYDAMVNMTLYRTNTVTINKVDLGCKLITASTANMLNTYSDIQARVLLSQATLSASIVGNKLIMGIHYDNNFNQWAIINAAANNNGYTIKQGYGFVGVDGSLTGGELPYKYFDDKGFSDTVYPLESLNRSEQTLRSSDYIKELPELYSITDKIVGTAEQQWYITKDLGSIVSHIICEYKNGNLVFTPVQLCLNNNYSVVYESGSFAAQVLGDSKILSSTSLKELLGVNTQSSLSITTLLSGLCNTNAAIDSNANTINSVGNMSNTNINDSFNYADSKSTSSKRMRKFKSIYKNTKLFDIVDFDIFNIAPIMSNINYLQQSVGQYAYVHYNSSNNIPKGDPQSIVNGMHNAVSEAAGQEAFINSIANDKLMAPVSYDELSFDTQVVKQVQSCDAEWPAAYLLILSIAMSALDVVQSKLQVNNASNQVALAGMNNSTQMYSLAMNSLAMSDLQTQKIIPTQVSEVTAVKTLDMFYSTSRLQKVYAGPGFVNHNFVAQCIAQSVTSTQIELKQQKIQWIIKLLTEGKAMILSRLFAACEEAVHIMCDAYSGSFLPFEIALSMLGISFSLLHAVWNGKLAIMDNILNCLGGDVPKISLTAALSKHTYDIEGKHRYGNSSKSFMWPCFGCDNQGTYTDEYVEATTQNKKWSLDTPTTKHNNAQLLSYVTPNLAQDMASFTTQLLTDNEVTNFKADMPYFVAMCKGAVKDRVVPNDMAYVIGTESFLSKDIFKNETIGQDAPVFAAPVTQDYMLSAAWQLGVTATAGGVAWVSIKDTKVIDGAPSNIIISPDFCGIASSYTAVEVKRGLYENYMRPVTVTPSVLALNCTGYNALFEDKAYHGFDGYGSRIVSWIGAPGMNKEYYSMYYSFIANDRLKRSNKLSPNQFMGNFKAEPYTALHIAGDDRLFTQLMQPSELRGLEAGTPGEDKDQQRYAIPVLSEYLNTLPAAVKTLSSYTLAVVDGVTSLCTDIRNTQTEYKAPISVDFNIGAQLYRATQEYICRLNNSKGLVSSENLVPILGLTFLGASPYEAYFYSQATRQYYVYTGGTEIRAVDTVERFRDIKNGYWDFVNQEVVMPCVATFDRLDNNVKDDTDETDNIIIPVIKNGTYRGEVPPPVTTIFDTNSWFKTYSLPSGVVFQGPNRCIINRFVWSDYMLPSVLANRGKWKKVPKEEYHPFRDYTDKPPVVGWTHNPFLLVTSPLGVNEETDCKFEWEITFAWTVEMDKLYDSDNYACVNVVAETMEPGGKEYSRPTHIYLTKDLFTRSGNYGYYSFRYQSNNGIGNRERLHIWADSYIAISSVQCAYKPMTTRRTEVLTQQVDIKGLKEM